MDYGQSVVSEQTAVASGSLQTAESSAPAQQTDSAAGKAAAKQQNRVTTNRACDNCRRRKIRCDAVGGPNGTESALAEQACTLCTTQGVPCQFEYRPQKRAPAKGYVESLEKRLEAMEGLLSALSGPTGAPSRQQPPANEPPPPAVSQAPLRAAEFSTPAKVHPLSRDFSISDSERSPSSEQSPAATDLDAIQRLSERLDDLEIEHNRYIGRESGMHLLQGVHEHLSVNFTPGDGDTKPPLVDALFESLHATLRWTVSEMPADLGPRLIDAYYKYSEWGFTLLPRQYLEECLQNGLLDTDRSFRSLCSRFVEDPRLIPQQPQVDGYPEQLQAAKGFDLFWASMVYAKTPLVAPSLFDLMQSAVTLIWLLGSSGLLTGWTVAGIALRRAVDAGIHREERSRWKSSPLTDQLRKRLFFMLSAVDDWVSATLGRPSALSKDDVDVALPLEITDDQLWAWELASRRARKEGSAAPPAPSIFADAKLVGWTSLQTLFDVMGTARKLFYAIKPRPATQQATIEGLRHIDKVLNRWLETLDAELRWNPSQQDDNQVSRNGFLACHYFFTQIYVHRNFISPSRSHALGYPSLAIATNAARACARILDVLRQRNVLDRAFAWGPLVAVQSGMILLLAVFANPPGPPGSSRATLTPSAAADVKRCLIVLDHFSDKTFMAQKCYDGLSRLASLVVAPPASDRPAGSNQPSDALRTSMKRGGLEEWTDGRSPADSTRGSGSDKQSPVDSGPCAGLAEQGHKARRGGCTTGFSLPFSTEDLSCHLFNGRPTFFFDQPTSSEPSASDLPEQPASADARLSANGLPPPIPSAIGASAFDQHGVLDQAGAAPPFNTGCTSYPPPHVTPTLAQPHPQPQGFDLQMPPGSPDLLSALYSSGAYDSSSFWQLAFDDPLAVPSTVEQVASDLMLQLGLPNVDEAGNPVRNDLSLPPPTTSTSISPDVFSTPFTTSPVDGLQSTSYDPSLFSGVTSFSGI
ncbi:hypothetical protein C6P46_000154 [Rhodotorula mucilaginosa]|uniref:Zn(2)-C6 fungal-type domain-containing protein n=1 Tax=Rhodotorula mucilaginosa TaxID=5537 RepID=A0A9P6WAY8_RHOMI|nr:hypothetical protein C6P46_000154 [Rhodotorula mucilaginosa]